MVMPREGRSADALPAASGRHQSLRDGGGRGAVRPGAASGRSAASPPAGRRAPRRVLRSRRSAATRSPSRIATRTPCERRASRVENEPVVECDGRRFGVRRRTRGNRERKAPPTSARRIASALRPPPARPSGHASRATQNRSPRGGARPAAARAIGLTAAAATSIGARPRAGTPRDAGGPLRRRAGASARRAEAPRRRAPHLQPRGQPTSRRGRRRLQPQPGGPSRAALPASPAPRRSGRARPSPRARASRPTGAPRAPARLFATRGRCGGGTSRTDPECEDRPWHERMQIRVPLRGKLGVRPRPVCERVAELMDDEGRRRHQEDAVTMRNDASGALHAHDRKLPTLQSWSAVSVLTHRGPYAPVCERHVNGRRGDCTTRWPPGSPNVGYYDGDDGDVRAGASRVPG